MAAQQLHARVGSTVTLAATLSTATDQRPQGLRLFHQKVVGVVMTRDNPVPINALAQLPFVYASRAFYDGLGSAYRSFDGAYVRLRPGASAFQFVRQAEALAKRYPATGGAGFVANLNDQVVQVERAIRPEAISLALFALVVALTGLVVIAQALLRLLRASRTDQATLRALGLTRRQMWSVNLMQVAVMAVVGASIAVLLSVLLSPTMPLGAARVRGAQPRHRCRRRRARSGLRWHRRVAARSCRVAILANRPGHLEHRGERGRSVVERPTGLALADRHPGDGFPRHP